MGYFELISGLVWAKEKGSKAYSSSLLFVGGSAFKLSRLRVLRKGRLIG